MRLHIQNKPTATPRGATYVGRLAPSPTGLLHLGHVRTFAMALQRAQQAGGAVLLRIDDLDPQRSRPEYVAAALEDLAWLGFEWQGEPVMQSARIARYREAWAALVQAGWVYPCHCSRRELAAMAGAPHEGAAASHNPAVSRIATNPGEHAEPLYPGTCRPVWPAVSSAGATDRATWLAAGPMGRNWRFRVPDGERIAFLDGGQGPQRFLAGRDFGDFAVWRRDDVPAYQLVSVVDDMAMGVTEVVRGADLLLSAARQELLFRALGAAIPGWFHCPLAVDAAGQRLAKRSDALAVRSLRGHGLTPEAVLAQAEALAVLGG